MLEAGEIECVAGRGVAGDRFFDYKAGYKGQITFFEHEVFEKLRSALGAAGRGPSVFRRNVITKGIDLNSLIGETFQIQGVAFAGVEECKPCHWMDSAFAPGAHKALKNHGGLRARILTSGKLVVTGGRTTPLSIGAGEF